MTERLSRRSLFHLTVSGGAGLAGASSLFSQDARPERPKPALELPPVPIVPIARRSTVSLVRNESRRKAVYESLMGIDAELRPALRRKKYVLIKPNLTSPTIQLASTHVDAVFGVLDYLAKRFKGPVIIAESASADTMVAYDNFKYNRLISEAKSQKVSLLDLNIEAKYVLMPVINYNVHPVPVRVASRLLDPDAFVLCVAIPKSHSLTVMTGAVKNMAVGGVLRSAPKDTVWNDKPKTHGGARLKGSPGDGGGQQMNYNLMMVSQRMAPNWGATVLDAYEGMQGEGPLDGEAVPSRIAIASTDYIAADRVAVEAMGMEPKWLGYLQYLEQAGVGNYDISKIDVRGETIASVKKTYRPHSNIERALDWMGPMGPPSRG